MSPELSASNVPMLHVHRQLTSCQLDHFGSNPVTVLLLFGFILAFVDRSPQPDTNDGYRGHIFPPMPMAAI